MNGFGGGGGFLTNNNNSAGRGGYGGGNNNYGGNSNYGGGYGGRGGNNYDDSASKMNTTPSKGGWNPNNNKKGSIIPLTIKKLIEISGGMDDVIEVDKYSVDQAVLVARVYKFEEQSTRVILHMDDTTGRIQVAYYKKNDAQATAGLDKLDYEENMYVKAVIVVRPFKNQKLYVSNMLQKVTDYNQVTYHFLSTFLASAYRLKGALPNRPEPDNANKNPSTQNNVQSNGGMGMNFGMGGGLGNKDPRTMVKEMIMHIQHQTNNGICKQSQLFTSLRGKVDPPTIQECLMRLENDGEICHNDTFNGEVEYVMLGS